MMPQDRRRKVLPEKELNELAEDSTKIYADNFIDTYYKNRPEALEPLCLYDFFSSYEYHRKNDTNIKGWLELQNNVGWVRVVSIEIPKIPYVNKHIPLFQIYEIRRYR